MADEQAQLETTSDDQTLAPDDIVSEDVETTSDEPGSERENRGDYRKAMEEERRKRQELERRLQDPEYVYQLAKQHGMTDEEAQAQADQAEARQQTASPRVRQPEPDVSRLVQTELRKQKAFELYPELAKNEEDQIAVSALLNKYPDPVEAAKRYYSRFTQATEKAKAEGAQAAKAEITEKERAQTATATQQVDSDAQEWQQLQRDAANPWDKTKQQRALMEIMKRKNKQAGI